jgi:hypothetical protein
MARFPSVSIHCRYESKQSRFRRDFDFPHLTKGPEADMELLSRLESTIYFATERSKVDWFGQ